MAVDILFMFEEEKPAGKHGFLRADGEKIRCEAGALTRGCRYRVILLWQLTQHLGKRRAVL